MCVCVVHVLPVCVLLSLYKGERECVWAFYNVYVGLFCVRGREKSMCRVFSPMNLHIHGTMNVRLEALVIGRTTNL